MTNKNLTHKEKKISLVKKIKHKIFFLFRLNNHPVIKVYNGFGNHEKFIVLGHVLKLSPMPRKTYRHNWVTNLFSILRLFMVVPFSSAKVSMEWRGITCHTKTEKDGFFRFEIFQSGAPVEGWQSVTVKLEEDKYQMRDIHGCGQIYIPFPSQLAFISDIDDTFLVSHSSRLRRRLYVLFTKNAHTRKPFEGVVNHYQLLACSGQVGSNTNPFFYVSGSEWNLYDFIVEFSLANKLPKGVFLLSQMKKIKEFWKSGQNNLSTKFMRIVRIVEAYPHLQFILLGDDSQQDPFIYSSIVSHFPQKIIAVYIRRIDKSNNEKVQLALEEIEKNGVSCCYFKHSAEAVIHSKKIGLISSDLA
ncbi:MAG: App1 family protein [Bacteroidota bacterium]|nr:App1 family protein [Bacteroidota bacterium]